MNPPNYAFKKSLGKKKGQKRHQQLMEAEYIKRSGFLTVQPLSPKDWLECVRIVPIQKLNTL